MKSQAPPSTQRRAARRLAGYLIPGGIVAFIGVASRLAESRFGPLPWLMPAALTLALLVGARLMVMWWKEFDEVAREAHLDSWFWGGSAGLAVSAILLVTVSNYSDTLLADVKPILIFNAGAACMFLPLVVGYLIWWAAWWLRRR